MRTVCIMAAVVSLACAACGSKEAESADKTTNQPGSNPIDAPADYLGAINKAQKSSVKVIDKVSLNNAVQMFYASEGRFPKNLQEAVTEGYLNQVPEAPRGMKIVYDAKTGKVDIVAQ